MLYLVVVVTKTDINPRLPLAFYLKLFGHELSVREKSLAWFVMLASLMLSIIGTVWAFLPKELIGARE